MASLKAMAKEAKSKKKPTTTKKESKKAAVPIYKSAEFIEDSDGEDKKSEDESESDDENAPIIPAASIPDPNGRSAYTDDSSSESSSGSDEEEGSSSEEDEDEEMADVGDGSVAEKEVAKQPAGITVSFKTALYKPPSGFEQGKLKGNSKASQMFKRSNLEGKQVWYFTAPASVPVTSIESMSLLDVKSGKPVLEHNGGDYAFLQDSAEDRTYTRIMVPSSSDEGYRTAPRSIDQVFHLQQIVKLAGIVDDAPTSNHSCARVKKPARPQPKGLKMRFRPLGFGNGDLGNIGSSSSSENDDEMDDTTTVRESAKLASKPTSKTRSEKHSSGEKSLKRKQTENDGKKSKNSSSDTSNVPDNQKLKSFKENKTESQIDIAGMRSASTNLLAAKTENRQRKVAVPYSMSTKPSHVPESHRSQSFSKLSEQKDKSLPTNTALKSDIFLEMAPGTEDPWTALRERKGKIKKLKKARCEGNDGA